jgi:hypothetical protein
METRKTRKRRGTVTSRSRMERVKVAAQHFKSGTVHGPAGVEP